MKESTAYATAAPPTLLLQIFLTSFLWKWIVNFARNRTIQVLRQGIIKGRLKLTDPIVGTLFFGSSDGSTTAVLNVTDELFWVRILFSYDIGFSEAYMAGEFQTPDLKAVLNLYIDNLSHIGSLASPFYRLLRFTDIFSMFARGHDIAKSVENVAGYNASNSMYKAFLSSEMSYSCPVWSDEEGGVRGDLEGHRSPNDLEAAQARKIDLLLKKARLRPGKRLLEIGTGWGGLAIAAAKLGCIVDTITISEEQYKGAKENISSAGVEDKVRVHLLDYRHMPAEFEKAFDACISVEMLEAVGVRYMKKYIRQIDWALKDNDATVVLTATTYPESTYTPYQGNDFTRKYHWPNGVSPSPTSLLNDFQKYGSGRFCVDYVEDLGDHYPRCLREWHRRFDENWNDELASSLCELYPELNEAYCMDVFRRKWHYMFMYMDVAYSRRWLGLTCWALKRPGQTSKICS